MSKKVLVDTSEVAWHALATTTGSGGAGRALSSGEAAILRQRADEVFAKEVKEWEAFKAKRESGDDRYMKQVLKSGTLADKVAAMTLMVGESPVHRLGTLEELLKMAKSGRHTSKMAIESLKDFFAGEGLPDGRRLVALADRGSAAASASARDLVLFAFEDRLRKAYGDFVGVVQGYLKHQAKELRRFAAETCVSLLKAKPEREAALLEMVVNKLGDPEPSVAGRASQLLLEVLKAHRAMTPVVAAEVQAFATRQGNSPKASYAAVSFLNQIFLSPQLADLAASLVAMYVALFSAAVAAGELQTKLLSALLTGADRCRARELQRRSGRSVGFDSFRPTLGRADRRSEQSRRVDGRFLFTGPDRARAERRSDVEPPRRRQPRAAVRARRAHRRRRVGGDRRPLWRVARGDLRDAGPGPRAPRPPLVAAAAG